MSKQGRFSIRMPKDKLEQLLALCYKSTVEKRGGTYAVNAELKGCIKKVAAILCGEDRRFGVMFVGNVATPMIDLLEYRYDRQLLTFITTNLTRQMRQTVYGERIADRFNEMFTNIVFKNGSYR